MQVYNNSLCWELSLSPPPSAREQAPSHSCCVRPSHRPQPPHIGVPVPGPPRREHLAPAAGWRGWRCPQCWRLGRCRPRSFPARPAGSTASRSAPRGGVSEGRRPCTSEAGQQREAAPQAQEAHEKPRSGPPLSLPSHPRPPAPLSGLHRPLTVYLVHPAQPQDSLAPDPGPGQGPVLGASKSHEAVGCHGPHNAGSRAPVPELPAPGEVSAGTEGVLQRERHQRLPEGLSGQRAQMGRQIGAAALSPATRPPT